MDNGSGGGAWRLRLATVWGGQAISLLTSSVLQMGIIWHITATTGSAAALSLASIAGFVPLALFGAFSGALVDRLPIKHALVGADLFVAAVSALMAVMSATGSLPIGAIMAVLFLRALGSSVHSPAFSALTPLVAPADQLTRLAGVSQVIQSGGYILGTALAAVVYPAFGLTAMVVLDVAGALAASAIVALAKLPEREGGAAAGDRQAGGLLAQARSVAAETREGYRVLKGYRGLFALLWTGFLFTLVFSPISALFPLMTLGHFGGTTADAAFAEIAFSVGMIVASAGLGATGGFKNRAVSVVAATALFGAATLAAGLLGPDGFVGFLACAAVMGISSPLYSGPQVALMQERVAPEYLGRVFGLYGSIMSWAMPAGLAVSALLADGVGVAPWFVATGAIMLALAAATWAIPSIRHIEREG